MKHDDLEITIAFVTDLNSTVYFSNLCDGLNIYGRFTAIHSDTLYLLLDPI